LAQDAGVPSAVYEARGLAADEIARRAASCLPRFVTSGLTVAPTIITSDPAVGFVEARNYVPARGVAPAYRSRITVEAKDGRFRIAHHDVEVMFGRRWLPIPPAKMTAAFAADFNAQSAPIAECVRSGPVGKDF